MSAETIKVFSLSSFFSYFRKTLHKEFGFYRYSREYTVFLVDTPHG